MTGCRCASAGGGGGGGQGIGDGRTETGGGSAGGSDHTLKKKKKYADPIFNAREKQPHETRDVRYWGRCSRCTRGGSGRSGGSSNTSAGGIGPNAERSSGVVDIINVSDVNCFQSVTSAADGLSIPPHEK